MWWTEKEILRSFNQHYLEYSFVKLSKIWQHFSNLIRTFCIVLMLLLKTWKQNWYSFGHFHWYNASWEKSFIILDYKRSDMWYYYLNNYENISKIKNKKNSVIWYCPQTSISEDLNRITFYFRITGKHNYLLTLLRRRNIWSHSFAGEKYLLIAWVKEPRLRDNHVWNASFSVIYFLQQKTQCLSI